MVDGPRSREKQKVITFFNARAFTATAKVNSRVYYCEPYNKMLVLIHMPDTTGTPTDILLDLEWSDDKVTWYKFMVNYWGDLRWEDTGAPYNESVEVDVLAPYVRFSATSAGASAQAYFTLTVKGIFNEKLA